MYLKVLRHLGSVRPYTFDIRPSELSWYLSKSFDDERENYILLSYRINKYQIKLIGSMAKSRKNNLKILLMHKIALF